MTHNLRWLLVFWGIGLVLYGFFMLARAGTHLIANKVASDQQRQLRQRNGLLIIFTGVALAWLSAARPPFQPWQPVPWARFFEWAQLPEAPKVLLTCAGYLAIVALSSRGLIGLPQYRLLQARADELEGLVEAVCEDPHRPERQALLSRIDRARNVGALKIGWLVLFVPLPSLLRATRSLNSVEEQLLLEVTGGELRFLGRQITARLPDTTAGKQMRSTLLRALEKHRDDMSIRDECVAALMFLHRSRDEPRELEADRVRVAIWLTLVGLAVIYTVSVTFASLNQALIAGALGGMLGSLSTLILRQTLSLGILVLSPVAGALNAAGGLLLVGFLAQEELQLLGAVFQGAWTSPTTTTALAVALLLGFSGGLFSRIAVTGIAPLNSTNTAATAAPDGPASAPPDDQPAPAGAGDKDKSATNGSRRPAASSLRPWKSSSSGRVAKELERGEA